MPINPIKRTLPYTLTLPSGPTTALRPRDREVQPELTETGDALPGPAVREDADGEGRWTGDPASHSRGAGLLSLSPHN